MDKAIEIKRRAQRCILNGDLDGALAEYEKLIASGDTDPYSWVLLADLLYKKGNAIEAQRRYLEAVDGYERNGLYKNGIAVCKKMARLSLAPLEVAKRLASLYTLDGLASEAVLAHQQYAEMLVKHDRLEEARDSLAQAAELNPESGRSLDRLGEIQALVGNPQGAATAWREAATRYERSGHPGEAKRCLDRIGTLDLSAAPSGTSVDTSHARDAGAPEPARSESSETGAAPAEARAAVAENILGSMMATPRGLERPDERTMGDASSHHDGPPLARLELEPISGSTEPEHAEAEPEAEQDVEMPSTSGLSLVGLDPATFQKDAHESRAETGEPRLELVPREPFESEAGEYDITDESEVLEEAPRLEATNGEIVDDPIDERPRLQLVPTTSHAEAMYVDEDGLAGGDSDAGQKVYDLDADLADEPAFAYGDEEAQAETTGVPDAEPAYEAEPALAMPHAFAAEQAPSHDASHRDEPVDAYDEAEESAYDDATEPAPDVGAEPAHDSAPVLAHDVAPEPVADVVPPGATLAAPSVEATAPDAPAIGIQRFGGDETSPHPPGLGFGAAETAEPPSEPAEDPGLAAVSMILGEAQAHFHAGDRDAATMALMRAAQAYDRLARYDSAAAIYRSLGHSPDVSIQLMMLWLKNCQRRDDRAEAARVACELGDRALNDGDVPGARDWFERAHSYDDANELAPRRLKQINSPEEAAAPAPSAPPSLDAAAIQGDGFLHVRTDQEEPLIVELGSLIDEFRKAIEPELASDPQGNYDLAVSYREMGLVDQAVDSFRRAAADPAFRLRAGELAGHCLLDLGRFDEAADAFHAALAAPEILPSAAIDLRYQLGLALEAAGHGAEALAEFERVYAAQASYPDVAMKIRLLRKSAGAE